MDEVYRPVTKLPHLQASDSAFLAPTDASTPPDLLIVDMESPPLLVVQAPDCHPTSSLKNTVAASLPQIVPVSCGQTPVPLPLERKIRPGVVQVTQDDMLEQTQFPYLMLSPIKLPGTWRL